EAVEEVASDRDVARQHLRFAAPFEGEGVMVAAAILVGEAAVDRVAGIKGLAFRVGCRDQLMLDRPGRETPLELRAERPARAAGAVLLDVGQIILVGRTEQRRANLAAPQTGIAAGLGPDPRRGEAVAAAVERVGMGEGEGVEAVELG